MKLMKYKHIEGDICTQVGPIVERLSPPSLGVGSFLYKRTIQQGGDVSHIFLRQILTGRGLILIAWKCPYQRVGPWCHDWAEAQSGNQWDLVASAGVWMPTCGLWRLSHIESRLPLHRGGVGLEKQRSYGIQTTNSQTRLATRVCNTHMWKEESCHERGSWIAAHRGEEPWQSLCVHHSSVRTV